MIRAPAPDWFRWATSRPRQSQFVTVAGCRIHYLVWAREPARSGERGLLFVHGGGAHSHWWSYIAPYFTRDFRVAAIDLSGMGDSGWRAHYNSQLRAEEFRAVIAAAQLWWTRTAPHAPKGTLPAYQPQPVRLFSGCDSAAGAPATMQEPFPGCEQHLICQQPDRHDDHHDPGNLVHRVKLS